MGEAVDVKASDGIQKEGGGKLSPEHQGKPLSVSWFQRRISKFRSPLEEMMKEMRKTEPMVHLHREWKFSHTWDTMKSSRPNMAAIVVAVLATIFHVSVIC